MSVWTAPLRCMQCHTPIEKKPGAKTPKYCSHCRQQLQNDWKQRLRGKSGRRS